MISSAIVLADEAAAEGSQASPWLFGATALIALVALLIVTMMIKVGD
ncbi:MAG: hypothetical protein IPO93_13350 [Actinobacteria bacterium]|nr:hypothetical protein [Actinomycetota bacterium]